MSLGVTKCTALSSYGPALLAAEPPGRGDHNRTLNVNGGWYMS